MLSVLLALGAAASYGTADYLGGLASRGSSAVKVLFCSHVGTLAVLVFAVLVFPPAHVAGRDLAWAVAGGVFSASGVGLLYRGLGGGPMAIVSPISAVLCAAVPVVVDVAAGGGLRPLEVAGIAAGLLATVLVSMGPPPHGTFRDPRWLTVLIAAAAGIGIGIFMTMMAQCSPQAGLVPMLAVRCVTSSLMLGIAAAGARSLRARDLLPGHPRIAAGAGVLDTTGTSAFMVASSTGSLAVAGVLSAQFPVFTVALARWRLGERLAPRQVVGLALAALAVALFSLAT